MEATKTILPLLFRDHAGQRRLHRDEGAGQVDVEAPPPVGERSTVGRLARRHAGVGHDNVEGAASGLGIRIEGCHRRFVGHVRGDGEDMPVCRGSFGKHGVAAAANRHVYSGVGQRQRDRPADTRPAAGHQGMAEGDHAFSPVAALRSASR